MTQKKQILQAKGNLEQSGEFEVNPERLLTLSANGSKYIGDYKDDKKNGQGTLQG